MPIHSIFISSTSGNVVLSKYFDVDMTLPQNCSSKQSLFEQLLFKQTAIYWPTMQDGQPRAVTLFGSIFVVFKQISDLIVFVCGTDEADELIRKTTLLSYLLSPTCFNAVFDYMCTCSGEIDQYPQRYS